MRAFMTAVAPGTIERLAGQAIASTQRRGLRVRHRRGDAEEYKAITDGGFLLQIDDVARETWHM